MTNAWYVLTVRRSPLHYHLETTYSVSFFSLTEDRNKSLYTEKLCVEAVCICPLFKHHTLTSTLNSVPFYWIP